MKQTKIWAHRGSSAKAPENTLLAFDLAIRDKADGIELDIQRTADGELVVIHDEDCLRVTGNPGAVADMSLADLQKLNFAANSPAAGFQQIPTLAEVFDLIRPSNLTVNIELKNSEVRYPGMEEQVLDLTEQWGMLDRIQLSTFNPDSLTELSMLIKARQLSVPCGFLYKYGLLWPGRYAARHGFDAIHPHYANLTLPYLTAGCHARGIAVNVWTVDKPAFIAMAIMMGVDAVITDVPDQALAIRQKITHRRSPDAP